MVYTSNVSFSINNINNEHVHSSQFLSTTALVVVRNCEEQTHSFQPAALIHGIQVFHHICTILIITIIIIIIIIIVINGSLQKMSQDAHSM